MKHQTLIVYSHRKNEYITVDVDSDNRLMYFLNKEIQDDKMKKGFMKEVMEFIVECENQQK